MAPEKETISEILSDLRNLTPKSELSDILVALIKKEKVDVVSRKREKEAKELEEFMLIVKKDLEQIDSSFNDKKI